MLILTLTESETESTIYNFINMCMEACFFMKYLSTQNSDVWVKDPENITILAEQDVS